MYLNPEISEQVQEVIFSRKSYIFTHPPVLFNNSPIVGTST